MPKIHLLDATVADQIAAGEVVERPCSVVKELVENALDANASVIRVEMQEGGRQLIRVQDNGDGMDADDLGLAIRRHATSKIRLSSDLQSLSSFGFRGEALPSIASVSRFKLSSCIKGAKTGHSLSVDGGAATAVQPAGRAQGTTVEVAQLFYNTPARLKFLKTDNTEIARSSADLSQMALAHPTVAFHFSVDDRPSLDLPACSEPSERLRQLWGSTLAGQCLPVALTENGIHVRGWIVPPQLSRGKRDGQWLFVNGRAVGHRQLGYHVSQAYGSLLPHGRHPAVALFVELPPEMVDVNVHPAKREVRFRHESQVLDALRHAMTAALREANLYAGVDLIRSGRAEPSASPYPAFVPSYSGGNGGHAAPAVAESGPAPLFAREASPAAPMHVAPAAWTVPFNAPLKPDWPVPLAQLHKTYLLCQDAQGLVLVDQHAAHERILYERQLRAWATGAIKSQRLLLPQRIQASPAQADTLRQWMPVLEGFGLELQDVGGGLFFVASLPEFMKHVQATALVHDLLHDDGFDSQPKSGDPAEDFRRDAAAHLACKAAIKAGDPITWEGMQQLMADLSACEIPWSCPHGRPPLVRLSLFELEKYFQRR